MTDDDPGFFYQPPDEDRGKIFQFPGKKNKKDGDDE